ncbi:MAG: TlpA family protein disulfide reductase [Planctomycetales bacterium]|nr:TlpA family protein disulfide reductase [Planctomycetales bacterium]
MNFWLRLAPILVLTACGSPAAPPPAVAVPPSRDGADLLGREPPGFEGVEWARGGPVSLESLRGKVAVVRWWTTQCVLCERSAPALREIAESYGSRGVEVVGLFHEKPPGRPSGVEEARAVAERLGLPGAIGWDRRWEALRRWWLSPRREFTSVTFVLDRAGRVRFVHPGGEFHRRTPDADHPQCERDFEDVRAAIEALLAER